MERRNLDIISLTSSATSPTHSLETSASRFLTLFSLALLDVTDQRKNEDRQKEDGEREDRRELIVVVQGVGTWIKRAD